MKNFSPKQQEKYKRQKYIRALSKSTKNLFKLFRSQESSYECYKKRFSKLKEDIDNLEKIHLNSEYLRAVDTYLKQLYKKTIQEQTLTEQQFQELKSIELSNLNRLQKLKNQKKYSKEKYRKDIF